MFSKITLRGLKLGVTIVGLLYFAYLTFQNPKLWAINLILWPLAGLVIFDRGHAKAIDNAQKAIIHLKGRSEDADLILYHLSAENLEIAQIKLILLKHKLPKEIESITLAESAIDHYLKRKPWWHFK